MVSLLQGGLDGIGLPRTGRQPSCWPRCPQVAGPFLEQLQLGPRTPLTGAAQQGRTLPLPSLSRIPGPAPLLTAAHWRPESQATAPLQPGGGRGLALGFSWLPRGPTRIPYSVNSFIPVFCFGHLLVPFPHLCSPFPPPELSGFPLGTFPPTVWSTYVWRGPPQPEPHVGSNPTSWPQAVIPFSCPHPHPATSLNGESHCARLPAGGSWPPGQC